MELVLEVLCTTPLSGAVSGNSPTRLHHRDSNKHVTLSGTFAGRESRLRASAPGWKPEELVTLRAFVEEQLDGIVAAALLPKGHNPVLHVTHLAPVSDEAGVGCGGCLGLFRDVAQEFGTQEEVVRLLLQCVSRNQLVLQAVLDLREAARRGGSTPAFAYRAVERIRKQVARDAGVEDGKAQRDWDRMHHRLRSDPAEFSHLKARATACRHGDYVPQPWEHRQADLSLAWRTILRYATTGGDG